VHVGTSGWSYPGWKPGFYPPDARSEDFLRHYSERFDTVELNTTGYRLPAEEQFDRWAAQTPPGFEFAVKMPPRGLRDLGAASLRYEAQTAGYLLLLTARYPDASPRLEPPTEDGG